LAAASLTDVLQKAVASNKAHEKDSISMQFSDGNKYF